MFARTDDLFFSSNPHIAIISKPEHRPTNGREGDKGWPTSRRGFDEYCPYLGRFWLTGGSLSTSGFQKYSGRAGGARFCRTPVDFGPLAGRVACGFGLRAVRETHRRDRRDRHNASGTDRQRQAQTGIRHSIRHARADTETGIQAFRHSRPPAGCSPASAAELLHVEAGPAIRLRVPSLCLPCPALLCARHISHNNPYLIHRHTQTTSSISTASHSALHTTTNTHRQRSLRLAR